MSDKKVPSASEDLQRAASMTSWGGTSVPSRNVRISPPVVTDDLKTTARNRIETVKHRARILRDI